jgi:hypothetical protein
MPESVANLLSLNMMTMGDSGRSKRRWLGEENADDPDLDQEDPATLK